MNGTPKSPKPTNRELADRVDFVARLMAKGRTKTEIHRATEERYGVGWRTSDRYMARVRDDWGRHARSDVAAVRAESIQVYEEIMRDPKASAQARIKARERIDLLFGADAPKRFEHSGPDGLPIPVAEKVVIIELPAQDAEQQRGAEDIARWRDEHAHVGGNGHGNGSGGNGG